MLPENRFSKVRNDFIAVIELEVKWFLGVLSFFPTDLCISTKQYQYEILCSSKPLESFFSIHAFFFLIIVFN